MKRLSESPEYWAGYIAGVIIIFLVIYSVAKKVWKRLKGEQKVAE